MTWAIATVGFVKVLRKKKNKIKIKKSILKKKKKVNKKRSETGSCPIGEV